jgi:hypothetical protein
MKPLLLEADLGQLGCSRKEAAAIRTEAFRRLGQ